MGMIEKILKPILKEVLNDHPPGAVEHTRPNYKHAIPVNEQWLVQNFLKLFESFLLKKATKAQVLEEIERE